jgi:hypothetical protein
MPFAITGAGCVKISHRLKIYSVDFVRQNYMKIPDFQAWENKNQNARTAISTRNNSSLRLKTIQTERKKLSQKEIN